MRERKGHTPPPKPPEPEYVSRAVLRSLDGTAELSAGAQDELAQKVKVEELPPGRQIFVRGHHDRWVYYLLEGHLELDWGEGRRERLIGGTPNSLRPLAPGDPRPASATARSPIAFIRIDQDLLDMLSQWVGEDSYALEEIRPDDVSPENRLFHRIYHDYMEDQLVLPHLPDIAFRVRRMTQNPDYDVGEVAHVIQGDPVLAAKLIQVTNSPLYGVQSPIYNLRAALVFLGANTVRNLVLTYTLRDLFRTDSPALKRRMAEVWAHCTLVSAISFVLAERTPGLDPDRAMLIGLLHDIGALPIINYAAAVPPPLTMGQLDEAYAHLRGQTGAMVLRHWQFGEEMVGAALEAEEWRRDPHPKADYVDLLLVAQVLSTEILTPWGEEPPPLEALPAAAKVAGGGLTDEAERDEVLRRAREDVADVLYLFT